MSEMQRNKNKPFRRNYPLYLMSLQIYSMKNQLTGFQLLTTAFKVLFCNDKPNCSG